VVGKTVIALVAIDYLRRSFPTSDVGIAFVYCHKA
jgi:hypothetical protein